MTTDPSGRHRAPMTEPPEQEPVIEVVGLGQVGHRSATCGFAPNEPAHHACWVTAGGAIQRVRLLTYDQLRERLALAEQQISDLAGERDAAVALVIQLRDKVAFEKQLADSNAVDVDRVVQRLALAEVDLALWQQRYGDAQAEITRLWARLEKRTAEANRLELEAAYLREHTE